MSHQCFEQINQYFQFINEYSETTFIECMVQELTLMHLARNIFDNAGVENSPYQNQTLH